MSHSPSLTLSLGSSISFSRGRDRELVARFQPTAAHPAVVLAVFFQQDAGEGSGDTKLKMPFAVYLRFNRTGLEGNETAHSAVPTETGHSLTISVLASSAGEDTI